MPDWVLFDLDSADGATIEQSSEVAQLLHGMCDRLSLPSVVKTMPGRPRKVGDRFTPALAQGVRLQRRKKEQGHPAHFRPRSRHRIVCAIADSPGSIQWSKKTSIQGVTRCAD